MVQEHLRRRSDGRLLLLKSETVAAVAAAKLPPDPVVLNRYEQVRRLILTDR